MSCFRRGDPHDDFDRYDRQQSNQLAAMPECDICGHPIQDDYYYEINGDNVCPVCLENHFRKEVAC